MNRLTPVLAAAVMAAAPIAAAPAARAQDIVVGLAGPLTGAQAAFGEQMKRGAAQAVADINAKGGVLGRKLAVEYGDDASDPRQGVAVANQMASKKVVAVIGHFNSGVSIPASEVYAEEGILQITPASTNPTLTDRGAKFANVFRTCGRDDKQGVVAGNYLAEHYKGKPIAILHDKSAYGKGLADQTKLQLNKEGVQEAMYEAVTAGDKDFTSLISKLKAASIAAIYYGGYHAEAGLIVRQAREQGLGAQLISGDALVTQEFWSITGKAGEGTLMTFEPDPRKFDSSRTVVEAFKKQGYDPEGYTLNTYAALQVFATAVEKAKSTKLDDLIKAMRATEFETVLGPLAFDQKGDLANPKYVFYVWKDGKYSEM